MKEARQIAKDIFDKSIARKNRLQLTGRHRHDNIAVKDFVWLKPMPGMSALQHHWLGPFAVLKIPHPYVYVLDTGDSNTVIVHADRIKKANIPEDSYSHTVADALRKLIPIPQAAV